MSSSSLNFISQFHEALNVHSHVYSIKNCMGPCQRTPKEFARATRYSGLGVRSVGPVGDFLNVYKFLFQHISA